MKKLYNKIYDLFNPWKRNVKVSQAIYNFYIEINKLEYYIDKSKLLNLHITNVLSRYIKDTLHIQIELERPGLLIGKCGQDIKSLQLHLEQEFNCLVEIKIVESTLWNFNKY